MMNRFFYILFFIVGFTLLWGCEEISVHELRVENRYPAAINISVGRADFGNVESDEMTVYKLVDEGVNQMRGDVKGEITLKGDGKHRWTLVIQEDGKPNLMEDE